MARPITALAVTMLALNLFAGMLMGTGVAANLGLSTAVGGDQAAESTVDNATDQIKTGAPTGDTLFGFYNVLATGFSAIAGVVTAAPTMMANAGVPTEITSLIQNMIALVYALDIISFARGWGL